MRTSFPTYPGYHCAALNPGRPHGKTPGLSALACPPVPRHRKPPGLLSIPRLPTPGGAAAMECACEAPLCPRSHRPNWVGRHAGSGAPKPRDSGWRSSPARAKRRQAARTHVLRSSFWILGSWKSSQGFSRLCLWMARIEEVETACGVLGNGLKPWTTLPAADTLPLSNAWGGSTRIERL
jgi:hypothetical protein